MNIIRRLNDRKFVQQTSINSTSLYNKKETRSVQTVRCMIKRIETRGSFKNNFQNLITKFDEIVCIIFEILLLKKLFFSFLFFFIRNSFNLLIFFRCFFFRNEMPFNPMKIYSNSWFGLPIHRPNGNA